MSTGISVVIPVYNNAAYLTACLESLATQQMGDFEALLLDDGSGDGSADILRRWQEKDPRFRAFFLPHGGVSATRNAGVERATGEYLFFLDADDLLPKDALASLWTEAAGADIVCAWHAEFDPDGAERRFRPECPPMPGRRVMRRVIEGDSVYNITCNKLFRRAFWLEQGLCYDAGLRIGEDALVSLRAFAGMRKAVLVPKVTYRYRIHQASAMRAEQGEYDRHLPYFRAVRQELIKQDALAALQGDLAAAMALRYYKQHGLKELRMRFNGEIQKELLPACPGFTGTLMQRGWYPAYYALTFPLRRVRWLLRRLRGRWVR